jgi:DNA adenine methylase
MRGPFAYYGGKSGLAPLIVGLLPSHRVYVEPFFGGGSVLFAKPPSVHEIVNDLDHNVVTFFRMLRERPEELELACRLTPYARAEYAASELDEDLDDLERARRFWVRVNQSFGKTAGRQTGFSVTSARTASTAASAWARIGRFAAVAERLQRVVFECCDAATLIERMALASDTVIYADPPYLAETRRGRDRQRPGDYLCDMGLAEDHGRLADSRPRRRPSSSPATPAPCTSSSTPTGGASTCPSESTPATPSPTSAVTAQRCSGRTGRSTVASWSSCTRRRRRRWVPSRPERLISQTCVRVIDVVHSCGEPSRGGSCAARPQVPGLRPQFVPSGAAVVNSKTPLLPHTPDPAWST